MNTTKKHLKKVAIICTEAAALWGGGWLCLIGINQLMSWLQL